jgi:hypothetical protein
MESNASKRARYDSAEEHRSKNGKSNEGDSHDANSE